MNSNNDTNIREAYQRLNRDHDRLADELMAAVADESPRAEHLPSRIIGLPLTLKGRWIMRTTVGLAAVLLLSLLGWFVLSLSPAPAYGIADLPRKLNEVKSMHIRGWHYVGDEKVPMEQYAERPTHYWHTQLGVSDDKVVTTGYTASDGRRYISVYHPQRRVIMGDEIALGAELTVEGFFNSREFSAHDISGFKRLRGEAIDGIETDVYEREQDVFRTLLWLDRARGLPVRLEVQADGQKWIEIEQMSFNVPRPAEMFTFEPPQGYEVMEADRSPAEVGGFGSSGAGSVTEATRFVFRLEDGAVLLCRAYYDAAESPPIEPHLAQQRGEQLSFTATSGDGSVEYTAYHLRADWSGEHHWQWMLLLPENAGEIGDGVVAWETRGPNYRFHQRAEPMQFPRERLARFVRETQKLTTPPEANEQPLTLEELEALARNLRK